MHIVRGMRAEDYHAVRAASSSRLKEILRSPAHLRWMDENGKTATALAIGEAFHSLVLEPQKFEEEFAVAPDVDRRTKEGKAMWQHFADLNIGRVVISNDDWNMIRGMADAVNRHSTASDLLGNRNDTELSMFWDRAGIRCKARIDAISSSSKCIIDLKSTQDASRDAFARSIATYRYHLQAAWYIDAARRANFDVETIVFIAVEKAQPHGVACYTLEADAIDQGRIEADKALLMLANSELNGVWPGYTTGIESLSLPRWAIQKEEIEL